MPAINELGELVHGRVWDWLTDDTVVGQRCAAGACEIVTAAGVDQPGQMVAPRGASAIAAGRGHWLAHLVDFGVFGPASPTNPTGLIPGGAIAALGADYNLGRGLSAPDGTIAVILSYQQAQGLRLVAADGTWVDYPDVTPQVAQVAVVDRTRALFTNWHTGRLETVGGLPVPQTVPGPVHWPTVLEIDGQLWIFYHNHERIVLHPFDDATKGYVSPAAHYPHARVVDGRVVVAWAYGPDDAAGGSRTIDVATEPRVELIAGGGGNVDVPVLAPWPRKLWVLPYYSHGRYGDTPLADHAGNGILLVEQEGDPAMLPAQVQQYSALGQPMFVQGVRAEVEVNINLTVGWWAGGVLFPRGEHTQLDEQVRLCHQRPEKPVLAYLDDGEWPETRPDWVSGRTWTTVGAYRNPGEPIDAFRERVQRQLDRVSRYGPSIGLECAFYTRNGAPIDPTRGLTVAEVLECMPLYERWIRDYPVVAVLMFADRRPTGMIDHPAIRAWALAFARAAERPSRWDYWQSDDADPDFVLSEKLKQSTPNIALSQTEKARILSLLGGSGGPVDPPPPPPPPPPPTDIPDHGAYVAQRWAEIGLQVHDTEDQNRAQSLWFLRSMAGDLNARDGGQRWGLLEKTGGNNWEGFSVDFLAWDNGQQDIPHVDLIRDATGSDWVNGVNGDPNNKQKNYGPTWDTSHGLVDHRRWKPA